MSSQIRTSIRVTLTIATVCFAAVIAQAQATITLRGRVTGIPEGGAPKDITVRTVTGRLLSLATVNPDGTFEISAVPVGKRDLTINLSRPGVSYLSGQTAISRLSTTVVSVDDKDVANIQVPWVHLASITAELLEVDKDGKLVSNVTSKEAVIRIQSLNGERIAAGCDYPGCPRDQMQIPLSPIAPHLLPVGSYKVQGERLPGGYSIKAINVASVDIWGKTLEINPNTSSVKIEILLIRN